LLEVPVKPNAAQGVSCGKIMTSIERRQKRYERRQEKRNKPSPHDDFSLLTDIDNLYTAYRKSVLSVSWKQSIQTYSASFLRNIMAAQHDLIEGNDVRKGFAEFDIRERGKTRHIKSVHISERVVQKCLCDQILVPVLSKPLIYDNSASRTDKGIHFAFKRLRSHLSRYYRITGTNEGYCLSMDFSKYFESIPHDLLLSFCFRYIKDRKVRALLSDFITVFEGGKGLGLGSQPSQICAIFFPSGLDHFIKERLGIKFYGRYMDDLYLIHESREYLEHCRKEITAYCENRLRLKVNLKKTQITPLSRGFVFLKGRYSLTEKGKILCLPVRGSTVRMQKKLHQFAVLLKKRRMDSMDVRNAYQSWRGNFIRRFNAYYRVRKTDAAYNKLILGGHYGLPGKKRR
jgi:hypothetical protein